MTAQNKKNTKIQLNTTKSFTVYNLLYCISQHIWYTWDRYLPPSSMDIRWQDDTGDTFALRNEKPAGLISFMIVVLIGLKAKNSAFYFPMTSDILRLTFSLYIMRMSCHEALSQPQHASMRRTQKGPFAFAFFCFCFQFSLVLSNFLLFLFQPLAPACIMTKRDSLLAGFTYPSSSMSMPRRHSRTSGYPSSTAAPSDSLNPSRSVTDSTASTALPTALPSLRHAGSSDQTSHYGYSTADTSTPIPAPADHQTPIPPRREEAYPLQRGNGRDSSSAPCPLLHRSSNTSS